MTCDHCGTDQEWYKLITGWFKRHTYADYLVKYKMTVCRESCFAVLAAGDAEAIEQMKLMENKTDEDVHWISIPINRRSKQLQLRPRQGTVRGQDILGRIQANVVGTTSGKF